MDSKVTRAGLFMFLLLLVCVAGAQAQEAITPEKRALIKELIELSGGTKNTSAMLEAMIQQQERDLPKILAQSSPHDKNQTPEERAVLEKKIEQSMLRIIGKMRDVYQRLNYVQVIEDISTSIFNKYFTEADLKELIAFYKSATGKKAIELMPTIFAESMSRISESLLPKMQEEINKIIAGELKLLEQESKPTPMPKPSARKRARH